MNNKEWTKIRFEDSLHENNIKFVVFINYINIKYVKRYII